MSFEFEKPTCFSPNGLVFGVLREGHAYSAPCRTTADGEIDNRIIWYFVPDGTPLYTGVNAFEPRVDNIYDLKNETMEACRLKPVLRKHYSGRDIWFRDASGVIGSADDFAGRSRVGDCLCQQGPPHPPCVSGPHAFNEIGFGVFVRPVAVPKTKQGLKLRGVIVGPLAMKLYAGLALGGVFVQTPAAGVHLDAGLALGGVFVQTPAAGVHLDSGLALGAVFVQTPAASVERRPGLALGGVIVQIPSSGMHLVGRLALGVHFPGIIASGSGSFGGSPGSFCATALNMDNDVEYTFDVAADADFHWFRFWLPEGWIATIAYRTNSGEDRAFVWRHGTCEALAGGAATHEALITFDYGPLGEDAWIYGQATNAGIGAGNYTVRISAE